MLLIDGDVALGPGDDGGYQKHCRPAFVIPSVSVAAAGALIGCVPTGDADGMCFFDSGALRNQNLDSGLRLWKSAYIGMDERFQHCACVGFRGVNNTTARRVPSTAQERRALAIEDLVAAIGDAISPKFAAATREGHGRFCRGSLPPGARQVR